MEVLTESAQETQKLGQKIAIDLVKKGRGENAKILTLYGKLGSGKTTFAQGFALGLGIPHRLVSPTFIIVREYPLAGKIFQRFYHIDLYRTDPETDSAGLGLTEIFTYPSHIVVVEWAEKLETLLPKVRIDIRFSQLNDHKRLVTFSDK